ncbi:hypothetical protein GZH47_22220 [Paenibacillus rhizovicinus]|uniref:Uncharacterized protein n=1 Tax=Paenibacillus rhizovicinus TaxID=2704463 RepID=A0A6C0P3X5_9BACL|nr:hypothetical protein [Paenibacillus rhizovicinus]QHW33234.1 hypothetical protein GZH47_22220 [Paenibacillus rhizovicinus]
MGEYKKGLRLGGEILKKFENIRKEIGFYEMVGLTITGDDDEGEHTSGYHTLDGKLYGDQLENEIRIHLKRAGKI